MVIFKYNDFCLNVLKFKTMCETCGQDNMVSTSIQIYDNFELSCVREKILSCVREKMLSYVREKKF